MESKSRISKSEFTNDWLYLELLLLLSTNLLFILAFHTKFHDKLIFTSIVDPLTSDKIFISACLIFTYTYPIFHSRHSIVPKTLNLIPISPFITIPFQLTTDGIVIRIDERTHFACTHNIHSLNIQKYSWTSLYKNLEFHRKTLPACRWIEQIASRYELSLRNRISRDRVTWRRHMHSASGNCTWDREIQIRRNIILLFINKYRWYTWYK